MSSSTPRKQPLQYTQTDLGYLEWEWVRKQALDNKHDNDTILRDFKEKFGDSIKNGKGLEELRLKRTMTRVRSEAQQRITNKQPPPPPEPRKQEKWTVKENDLMSKLVREAWMRDLHTKGTGKVSLEVLTQSFEDISSNKNQSSLRSKEYKCRRDMTNEGELPKKPESSTSGKATEKEKTSARFKIKEPLRPLLPRTCAREASPRPQPSDSKTSTRPSLEPSPPPPPSNSKPHARKISPHPQPSGSKPHARKISPHPQPSGSKISTKPSLEPSSPPPPSNSKPRAREASPRPQPSDSKRPRKVLVSAQPKGFEFTSKYRD